MSQEPWEIWHDLFPISKVHIIVHTAIDFFDIFQWNDTFVLYYGENELHRAEIYTNTCVAKSLLDTDWKERTEDSADRRNYMDTFQMNSMCMMYIIINGHIHSTVHIT